ncbi:MAG TPA: efflux RND transporter periplasmic adaptor subunit [Candidatus Acidoferrales bacterium]|nr:efflux RND transporter periplasmic adaptor subunit [Candidatus Acidoferrales bacterium]
MNRTRNLIIVLVALALVVGAALVIARRNAQATLAVNIVTVKRSTFSIKLPETGVVMNPATVTIPTLVGGNLRDIYVRAGQQVEAGTLLASIENPTLDYNAAGSQADYINAVANVKTARIQEQNARVQYQAQVDTNKSALDEARRVYEADVALLAQKAIAQNQVDADKAKLDQAQVAYDQAVAQLKLGAVSGYGMDSVQAAQANAEKSKILNAQNQQQVSFTRIIAPMSGVVQTVATQSSDPLRSLQPGDAVTAGQSLFTLASDRGYIVKAQVDEQDIFNVRVGQRAVISSEDFPGKSIVGRVRSIAPVAVKSTDPSSTAKQVLVTVALDRTPAYLKDGLTVDVDIYTTQIPNVIAIPTDAIRKEGSKTFVYVARDGHAVKTYISTTLANDTQSLVTSGLAPGDRLIDDKNTALVAGSTVKAAPSPSPSPGGASGAIVVGG